MPEQLSDEAILEIDDSSSSSAETSESVLSDESTESTTEQYGDDESRQPTETATDAESQGEEQQVDKEEREPANYEDLGSADELRELVDADAQIFSADRADNQQWLEKFSADHKDAFYRLFDLSISHVQKSDPARWARLEKSAVQGLFERDHLWEYLEAAYAANSGNPATQEFLQKFANYISTFGVGPAPQNAHPGFDRQTQDSVNNDLEKFFETKIDESLPQLRDLPAHSRARVLRQIHGELQNAIRADENHMAALKRVLLSGTPDALDRAIRMIKMRGSNAFPAIAARWGDAIPVPLGQREANGMDPRAILSSDRPADTRPLRTNRPTRLTRFEVNHLDPRKLLDYGPVVVRR